MSLIGIMGGTFNPIHIGHIQIAKAAYEQYHLDEIWFMPNHIPAYKSEDTIVSGNDRLKMVQIAIQNIPYCKASDFELKREGNTYTIDTLKSLKMMYPTDIFYFIMGADSLFDFRGWREADSIPDYATILVAPRDEKTNAQITAKIAEYNAYYGKKCFEAICCDEIPCSSSNIRNMLHELSCSQYLPDGVYQYIKENHLYLI